jgi:CheY-like chemotaxis protein
VADPATLSDFGQEEGAVPGRNGQRQAVGIVARFLNLVEAEDTAMQTGERNLVTPAATALRRVVVVNGNSDVLELLESALDGGRYDLLFADAGQHAYSLIKREHPDLVVLSVRIDAMEGFQLLSMLKLDPATRDIPVVTYATDASDDDVEDDDDDDQDDVEFTHRAPMRLH